MKEIRNALPVDVARLVRQAFVGANYDKIIQERRGHFQRNFNESKSSLPDNDELYTAYFHKSNFLENSDIVNNSYRLYIKPLIEEYVDKQLESVSFRCYRMIQGGHFRMHIDDYTADYGFIWYLSEKWKWDWGGLLLTVNEDQSASVAMPEFNKLVILKHENGQTAHCVTHIADYALEPRYMLVGFVK